MNLYAVSSFGAWTTVLGISLFVFLKNPRNAVNRTFGLLGFTLFLWIFGCFSESFVLSQVAARRWDHLLYLGIICYPLAYLHFIYTYMNLQKRRRLFWPVVGVTAVFLVFNFYEPIRPWFIRNVVKSYPFRFIASPGPLWYVLVGFVTWSLIFGLHLMWHRMRGGADANQKQKTSFLFISNLILDIGGLMYFGLVINILTPPLDNFLAILFTMMMAYAIVRHQVMDIKVTVTRTGLLLGIYLFVLGAPFVVGWWGRGWLEQQVGEQWWLVPLGLCTVLATAGPFAYAYLRRQAEERLLKEQRRYQRTLQRAARGMTQVRNLVKLSRLIARIVSRSVRVTHASLLLWDKTTQRYVLRASYGPKRLSLQSRYTLGLSEPLVQQLLTSRRILTEESLAQQPQPAINETLKDLGAALVVPGLIERDLIGFLVLGHKRSGAGYSTDDLHAFEMLAHEAAIAIENAMSYEELLKVNEQLKAAADRLLIQERQAAAGHFAAGMAHEIKNPLSAIKTFAQYLPEKYADPAFREKFFRVVQSEIDRINTIVKELSDFAKPAPLKLQPVHLAEIVQDTLTLLSDQCLKQGVEVRTSFGENGQAIQADAQQLKQVILNLLLNSLEAMPRGGRLEVVSEANRTHLLMLRVTDTGSGISPEHQQDIWDPFFTTKERGMGLGLAIVKGVVERHGGRIELSSVVGKGTRVELFLPTVPASF